MDNNIPTAEIEKFVDFLRKKKLKFTPERRVILENIFNRRSHFQAEDVLMKMRQKGIRISKATIYRTLPLLIESGLLREVGVGEKQMHYEYIHNNRRHDHLICINCGKITEFCEPALQNILQPICKTHQFTMNKYIMEIRGYCKDCQYAIPRI